ncbi:hypothetical protein chiPu_0009937 [Chiloscyllium punctatum]|uniref:Uncharacterized protein n=1 Tax=Chiloscyllium punctatum TaxID=137246 RepID=A0A401SM63_CHIPU|nr:hypothetical protein [Chiloscyllium punctatum]
MYIDIVNEEGAGALSLSVRERAVAASTQRQCWRVQVRRTVLGELTRPLVPVNGHADRFLRTGELTLGGGGGEDWQKGSY